MTLKDTYLKSLEKKEDWKQIAWEFEDEWDFPHCLEAIDGKSICIDCPKNASFKCQFNYENFHSTVLTAACDAKCCFLFVDIGSYGWNNDAAIFSQSELATGLESGIFFLSFYLQDAPLENLDHLLS